MHTDVMCIKRSQLPLICRDKRERKRSKETRSNLCVSKRGTNNRERERERERETSMIFIS